MSIETKNIERPTRYTLRLAYDDDLPYIMKYLQDPARPHTVFERTEDTVKKAIGNELMWLLTDPEGNINTTAAVHIIPVEANIGSTVDDGGLHYASLGLNFAEIGTVWKQKKPPSGFCLELMYSACILQTYLKSNDLAISTLLTQVVAFNKDGTKNSAGKNKIEQHLGETIGQGWVSYLPEKSFLDKFRTTIPDSQSRETALISFLAPVNRALLGASRCLLGENENNRFSCVPRCPDVIQALDYTNKSDPAVVEVDLKGTDLLSTAKSILRLEAEYGLGNLVKKEMPWHTARKELLGAKTSIASVRLAPSLPNSTVRKSASAPTL